MMKQVIHSVFEAT